MRNASLAKRLRRIVPYVGVVVGILVLASPVIADFIESWRADQTISQTTTAVEHIDATTKEELLAQAHAYNEQLVTHATNSGIWPYEKQLVSDSLDAMCWVQIPRIDVRLSVHHGTDEAALASSAGHVKGTSLPVGGTPSNCVLSAHSGMATARMFDDIHDLVPGDVFVLWTLGDPYAYRVVGSRTVNPDDVESLEIQPGKDVCTLVTCTPYGVNSQRLLVYGERCAYDEAVGEKPPAMYVSPRMWPLVAGLILCGGALALTSWLVIRARRRKAAGS